MLVEVPLKLTVLHPILQNAITAFTEPILKPNGNLKKPDTPYFRVPDLYPPFLCSVVISLLLIVLQLLVMLASIRRNLLQAFRGDYCEIPRWKSSENTRHVTGNFRFAGTLIGYVVLGYVLLSLFFFILAVPIVALITYGSSKLMEAFLTWLIPILLFANFKTYLNNILARYVFLQYKVNVLSLNNRRVFMIFMYFNIFLDAFLGLIAAIIRLLKSAIGTIIYMCRLDYSSFGRKLETKDSGFSAYCGFIQVECAHRHPILLCFISHLLRDQLLGSSKQQRSRARHKWALACFLINNPKLLYERKKFRRHAEEKQILMQPMTTHMDISHEQRTIHDDLNENLKTIRIDERF
jgi:hypothetical protein